MRLTPGSGVSYKHEYRIIHSDSITPDLAFKKDTNYPFFSALYSLANTSALFLICLTGSLITRLFIR
jgi:hypothetical protein